MGHSRKKSSLRRVFRQLLAIFFSMVLSGCAATCPRILQGSAAGQRGSERETLNALHTVAEAVSGQDVSNEEMVDLVRDIEHNEDTASAVKAITDSLQGAGSTYKYCPVCGKRYHPKIKYCPLHDVFLKEGDGLECH